MKSKKLIIFFCILVFLTVLAVLSSTLFTLQNISVNWMTTKHKLSTVKDDELTKNITLGKSIFLIDKDTITSNLEKKYPYIRIVGIETKFPNKLVIHVVEREVLFAVKKSDNDYALLDEYGKVLDENKTFDSVTSTHSLGSNPIKVDFLSLALKNEDFVAGEIVKVGKVESIIKKLAYSFKESNYNVTTSKGVFSHIEILSNGETENVKIITRRDIVINLKDAEVETTQKLLLGLARYNEIHQQGIIDYEIEVKHDEKTGEIKAS